MPDEKRDRWERVSNIMEGALNLSPGERDAYIDVECLGDPELRAEVISLLAAHGRPGAVDRLRADLAPVAARVRETTASGAASLEGRAFGPYRIIERIGGGGMGVVYKAQDTRLDRAVALKFLQPRLGDDASAAERFRLEARAIATLEHPNICTVHEIGETDDGQLYLAMPLYDGETLQQRIERGPLPVPDALQIAAQIARALGKAHGRGIIHRDIKPSNVLVTSDGVVKLLDFGIAKLVDVTLTGAAGPLGTVAYMSPEQVRGEPVDFRTDLWSLGVVLYEMLAGQRPYGGETPIAMALALQNATAPLVSTQRSDVPAAVEHVVARALSPADQRYQSAQDFEAALLGTESPGPPPARGTAAARRPNRTTALVGLAVVPVALGIWYLQSRPDAPSAATPAAVAVLPFADDSPGRDQEYFSDGITEELINTLARVEGLRVASRTSSFAFKGRSEDIRTIANQLGVTSVIEGSVRRAGDSLRISARLINAGDGSSLWSNTYTRRAGDAFAIQQEIAGSISQTLRVRLVGNSRPAAQDPPDAAAYELYLRGRNALYLKGRYAWYTRTESGVREALGFFEQAAQQDSMYVLAHAGVADAYAILGFYDFMAPSEAFPRAEAYARKAVSLDPVFATPRATLGYVALYHKWDFGLAEEEFIGAIRLNENYATGHQWYANLLTAAGRFDEAKREMLRAQEIDPLSLVANAALGWVQYYARDFAAAAQQCQRTLDLNPEYGLALLWRGWALQEMPDSLAAAVDAHRRAVAASDSGAIFVASLARSVALHGNRIEAESLLRKLEARGSRGDYVPSYEIAKVHEALGRQDRAMDWLERAYEQRSHSMVLLKVDPQLDRLRALPAFQGLVRQVFRE